MKRKKTAAALTAVLFTAVLSLTGCEMLMDLLGLPLTVEQRIRSFETALNTSPRVPSAIMDNFAPASEMVNREQADSLVFWSTEYALTSKFAFTITNSDDTRNVYATMVETSDGNALDPVTVKFVMYEEENGNYLIEEIWEGSNVIIRNLELR